MFPISVLKAALTAADEPELEGPPAPTLDLSPVVEELQRLRAVMDIVAKQPRRSVS